MNAPPAGQTDTVVAGNVYDKYETRNPIARRLMAGFDRGMFELLGRTGPVASILEVGCGEGHVTRKLAEAYPGARVLGTDLSESIVATARRLHPDLEFRAESIYDIGDRPGEYELIVACEVMEHLDEPERALRAIVAARPRFFFVSVPREPLWRILNVVRGRYLTALGNTPGHVQHWSTGAFVRLLARHADVEAARTPLPWTQALCRCRNAR